MGLGSKLVFEDEHCLGVLKTAGQFTQGSWAPTGEQTLEREVREYLCPADPSSVYLGIVHRLDRPVSGLLLWAKTTKAARRLSQQFERRKVAKEYWAIVEGVSRDQQTESAIAGPTEETPAEGTWIDWLTHAGVSGVVRAVPAGTEQSRQAVTRYRTENSSGLAPGYRWLRLWPETGRTHQLRVQAAIRGLPILGDSNYGSTKQFPQGIALHARQLGVHHPITGTPLILIAPVPASWTSLGFVLPDACMTSGNEISGATARPLDPESPRLL